MDYPDAQVCTGIDLHAAEGIADLVFGDEAALVCMSTHARHDGPGHLSGSVAAALLEAAEGPVLLVGPHFEPSRRLGAGAVLVALDGTASSRAAIGPAAGWAREMNVPLELVTVTEAGPSGPGEGSAPAPGARRPARPERWLADLAARWGDSGLRVEATVLHRAATAAAALTDYVDAVRAGFVVLASRPRRGIGPTLLGTTANDVVRDSAVPVLVVPRPLG